MLFRSAARSAFVTPTTSGRFFVAGYHPYWAGDAWTGYPSDALTELFFFELEASGNGSFLDRHGWPGEWLPMVEDALEAGVQVTPTISMHDATAFEELFSDVVAVDRVVGNIPSLLTATPGLAGVHLDFEVFRPVERAARDGFTAFVARLEAQMEALDPRLSRRRAFERGAAGAVSLPASSRHRPGRAVLQNALAAAAQSRCRHSNCERRVRPGSSVSESQQHDARCGDKGPVEHRDSRAATL